jgi:hypothetical protein
VIDVGQSITGGRRPYRINPATIAAIASSLGIVVYVAGFLSGYMLMRQNLTDLQNKVDTMQARMESVLERLSHVEADAHYTAQGIADLKALTAGTKR